MKDAAYYHAKAAHARRIAESLHQLGWREALHKMARDYDDIAEDLENGAIEIRHPERMPQNHK